jgi:hypothetical protein
MKKTVLVIIVISVAGIFFIYQYSKPKTPKCENPFAKNWLYDFSMDFSSYLYFSQKCMRSLDYEKSMPFLPILLAGNIYTTSSFKNDINIIAGDSDKRMKLLNDIYNCIIYNQKNMIIDINSIAYESKDDKLQKTECSAKATVKIAGNTISELPLVYALQVTTDNDLTIKLLNANEIEDFYKEIMLQQTLRGLN